LHREPEPDANSRFDGVPGHSEIIGNVSLLNGSKDSSFEQDLLGIRRHTQHSVMVQKNKHLIDLKRFDVCTSPENLTKQ